MQNSKITKKGSAARVRARRFGSATRTIVAMLLGAGLMAATAVAQSGFERPPRFVECPDMIVGSHCDHLSAPIKAESRSLGSDLSMTPIRYSLVSGPGTIDPVTGIWEYAPDVTESGDTQTVVIAAHQGYMMTTGRDRCVFQVVVENTPPEIQWTQYDCGTPVVIGAGTQKVSPFRLTDADRCPQHMKHWFTVEPPPIGEMYLDGRKGLVFASDEREVGRRYHVTLWVTDGRDTSSCDLYYEMAQAVELGSVVFTEGPCFDTVVAEHPSTLRIPIAAIELYSMRRVRVYLDSISPTPSGFVQIERNGDLVYEPEPSDIGQSFYVRLVALTRDDTVYCEFTVEVTSQALMSFSLETTEETYMGTHEYVDLTLGSAIAEFGGFDFLIGYDRAALTFQAVTPGEAFFSDSAGCGWEYFTYRYGPLEHCDKPECPSGLIRIVGIAETNDGSNHPNCFLPDGLPVTLFTIDFLVTENKTYECAFLPLRFFWFDCGDNVTTSPNGDTFHYSYVIRDYEESIMTSQDSFPTLHGAQDECFVIDGPFRLSRIRSIDFRNGGVQIVCPHQVDGTGDLNLNLTAYEIADAVLFSNYFAFGTGVFTIDMSAQIAESDINKDEEPLTIEDFVYLQRIITGDALPYVDSLLAGEATVIVHPGTIDLQTNDELGAAHLVVQGQVNFNLWKDNMEMKYAYDSHADVTRALIYSFEANQSFSSGSLMAWGGGDGTLLDISLATYDGGKVAIIFDSSAAGHGGQEPGSEPGLEASQNYPNPFNNRTEIRFHLPEPGQVDLLVFNSLGQYVYGEAYRFTAGDHQIGWDGVNSSGSSVASGVYYYYLRTNDGTSETMKMVLLK